MTMLTTTAAAVVDNKDDDNCKVRQHCPSINQPMVISDGQGVAAVDDNGGGASGGVQ